MTDNEIANAKMNLADAEREAKFHPDRAHAYVAIANSWIRLAELKVARDGVRAFQEKRFN